MSIYTLLTGVNILFGNCEDKNQCFFGGFSCFGQWSFWFLANAGGLVTAQVEVVRVSIGEGEPPSLPASSFFLPLHWLVSLPPSSAVCRPPSHWASLLSLERVAANQRPRRPWRPTAPGSGFSPEADTEASRSQWAWRGWRGWRSPTRCPCLRQDTGITQMFYLLFSLRTRS